MPNITVTVDEPTYRNARVWAALHNTTVTELVREFLQMVTRDSIEGRELKENIPAGHLENLASAFNKRAEMADFEPNKAQIEPFMSLLAALNNREVDTYE